MALELDVARMIMDVLGGVCAQTDEPEPVAALTPALDESQVVDQADATVAGEEELLSVIVQQQAENRQTLEAVQQAMGLVTGLAQRLAEVTCQAVPETVAEKARQALAKNPLILDYETTGIRRKPYAYYQNKSPKQAHQVVGAAIMDSAGHLLFQSRIDPQRPISPGATKVHGITDDQVAGLPVWDQIVPLLRSHLQDRPVVAFNAPFDASFTPDDWSIEWLDLKGLADEAFGQWHYSETGDWQKSGSLENRLRQCGLEPGPAHTAAGDCLSALRLLRYLAGYPQV